MAQVPPTRDIVAALVSDEPAASPVATALQRAIDRGREILEDRRSVANAAAKIADDNGSATRNLMRQGRRPRPFKQRKPSQS